MVVSLARPRRRICTSVNGTQMLKQFPWQIPKYDEFSAEQEANRERNRYTLQGHYLEPGTLAARRESSRQALATQKATKVSRLRYLREQQQRFPGRRPGGSGSTGLLSSDAQGWSNMLNQQTEAANLERELAGQGPLNVQSGHQYGGMAPSIADKPEWWLQGESDPREITAQSIPTIRRNLDRMPPSLRALYAERFRQR